MRAAAAPSASPREGSEWSHSAQEHLSFEPLQACGRRGVTDSSATAGRLPTHSCFLFAL